MNKLFITAAATAAIAASVPAAAQYRAQDAARADDFAGRIDQLEERLEDGIDAGTVSRREALSIRPQIRQFVRLEARYSYDGLNRSEQQELRQRLRSLRQELRVADGRGARFRDWDEDDRFAQYGGGDRYREVSELCFQPTGVQAIFSALLGADNCLRVGDRVTTGLGALPSTYRNDFRDSSRSYYRYLEGHVVEVDARSNTVAQLYDVR